MFYVQASHTFDGVMQPTSPLMKEYEGAFDYGHLAAELISRSKDTDVVVEQTMDGLHRFVCQDLDCNEIVVFEIKNHAPVNG